MFQFLLMILGLYVLACYAWGGYVAVRILTTSRRCRRTPAMRQTPAEAPQANAARERSAA